jgi:hypothetical protein
MEKTLQANIPRVTKKAPAIVRIIRGGISFAVAVTLARHLWTGDIFYKISDSQIVSAHSLVYFCVFDTVSVS